ncbi:MAG: ParB N-terminal domain-containing protein, partial [Nitrososphaerota archaeon]
MSLGLDPIHRLTPHERSIPSLSQKLASDIKSLGYVIHPVIVDAKTHVIVDGTHRAEALSILGAKFVPAYMVDYLGG